MAASLSSEEALCALYGTARGPESDPVYVYTDGSCSCPGRPWARAGSGVCWGLGSKRNSSHRVPGRQTSPRGELYATLQALLSADMGRNLHIRTDSENVIRSLCHWAPSYAESGWTCQNADLIAACASLLAARSGITRFSWVKGHSGNQLNDEADRLAKIGSRLPRGSMPEDLIGVRPALAPLSTVVGVLDVKVRTDLPRLPVPAPKAAPPSAGELLDGWEQDGGSEAPRGPNGRAARRWQAARNLHQLECIDSEAEFWTFVHHVNHARSRLAAVTLAALRESFCKRMNLPPLAPQEFAVADVERARAANESIPSYTRDRSRGQHFSRKFRIEDIAKLKAKIRSHSLGTARGADKKTYRQILDIPDDVLLELFNACLEVRNVPSLWLTTILAAILKRKMEAGDADSYRTIGLECCLLKCLTMLFDARIRDWVDDEDLLPKSQNGFRAGHRTNNNAFILRCAIDKARSQGKTLYLASVDISNAFPSVSHGLLWRKLYDRGMGGPIFDVYRLVYERMRYSVRVDGQLADSFGANMGILIGDPASPIMWALYFSDIDIPDVLGDVVLAGRRISHLEQADDIIIFATSPAALQAKLDAFYAWCCRALLLINKRKSWWMPLAIMPRVIPTFSMGGLPVLPSEEESYVGMRLCATTRNLFRRHSPIKAATAHGIASTVFAVLDRRCLECPPRISRKMYMALVDPHLTHGADISPDSTRAATMELERAQNMYLRRLLRVGEKASTVALFTETGIAPVQYRRADLLVRFLGYLLQRPADCYVRAALDESISLATAGRASWIVDVGKALALLPVQVHLGGVTEATDIDALRREIKASLMLHLETSLASNGKLDLLRARPSAGVQCVADWRPAAVFRFREYLSVKIPSHRRALTRLLLSEHPLAVERLRWEGYSRDERLCRFCRVAVEDAEHALLVCEGAAEVVQCRQTFWRAVLHDNEGLLPFLLELEGSQIIGLLSVSERELPRFARFVRDILRIFSSTPMYRIRDA